MEEMDPKCIILVDWKCVVSRVKLMDEMDELSGVEVHLENNR